jgi:malonyl-CoA O-methyltransferase
MSAERPSLISSYEKTLEWIKNNTLPEKGIVTTSQKRYPYLEVTGYLIPTLLDAGEIKLAKKYAEFLSYMQYPNGSFCGDDGKEYFFDTAQVLRGFNIAAKIWPEYTTNAIKAADFLSESISDNGAIRESYDGDIPESVKLYALFPLIEAGKSFKKAAFKDKTQKALKILKKQTGANQNILTHFMAYIIDGLIELGEREKATEMAKTLFLRQKSDGSISAYPKVNWVCSTGLAQIAIIGYKLGFIKKADKALDYLSKIQNESGGFFGSYGQGANYFPEEEIGWATKFYLDAFHQKIEAFFNSNHQIFPELVEKNDQRFKQISDFFGNLNGKAVLDVGCGKGRFAKQFKDQFPKAEITGIDLSEKLLESVPKEIRKFQGTILNLPFEDNYFDCVYCIETLEHAVRIERAVDELCRVTAQGGRIAIIDKNIERLGELEITDFEKWFDANQIKSLLMKNCSEVVANYFKLNDQTDPKLFIIWTGIKKSQTLDENEWHEAMIGSASENQVITRIKNNQFPVWIKPLLEKTKEGESMLELGSGTGELSVILAAYHRRPVLLDYSKDSLAYSKKILTALDLKAKFIAANILDKLPLPGNSIDWVWSSGTLEHFSEEELKMIMKESFRVCRKGVMSLLPNANSLVYRTGKFNLEKSGKWPYGAEIPKFSLKECFKNAGLKNIQEYSIGTYHSLEFINQGKAEFKDFFDSLDLKEIEKLNQGYLLFTYGEK